MYRTLHFADLSSREPQAELVPVVCPSSAPAPGETPAPGGIAAPGAAAAPDVPAGPGHGAISHPAAAPHPTFAPEPWLAAGSDRALAEAVRQLARQPECSGAPGEVTVGSFNRRRLVLLGIGSPAGLRGDALRAAFATALEPLHRMRIEAVRLHVDADALARSPLDPSAFGQAVGEGLGLGAFRFDEFKSPPAGRGPAPDRLAVGCDDRALARAVALGLDVAESANFARRLAAMPPNRATPAYLADAARQLARDAGLACHVYAGDALHERRMVGLHNVGKASEHEPCLIELVYEPGGTAAAGPGETIVLVGKAITFDSGGLSLKIHDTMRHMKYDKAAGCAVLGAMHAVARLAPACRVVGLLPAAENAISHQAYRVDDILAFPNGVSVDVTNTDFEGRLVMADALIHACQTHRPDVLIDLGTLTGEIIEALGHRTAGLWCDDDDLRTRLLAAGQRSGEAVWPMPLNDEHQQAIAAAHADVVNIALDQPGKPCQCAAFLSRFVAPGIRWAHLDVAGPVHVETDTPPFAIGPTGYGTRLLRELLANWP